MYSAEFAKHQCKYRALGICLHSGGTLLIITVDQINKSFILDRLNQPYEIVFSLLQRAYKAIFSYKTLLI